MNKQEKQLVEKVLPKFKMNEFRFGEKFKGYSMGLNMMGILDDYLFNELYNKFDTSDDSISEVIDFVNKCLTETTLLTKRMEKDIKGIEDLSHDEFVIMEKGTIG